MNPDGQARRVAGRQAVAARTVWQLQFTGLAIRCLRDEDEKGYTVQLRKQGSTPWDRLTAGTDPAKLLRQLACSTSVEEYIRGAVE